MRDNSIIVGLDIGTTKITTVIGEVMPGGTVDIIGEGTVSSEGMKRGSVVNLERATHAIRQSVQAAERVSGVKVHSVFVSVAGNHAKAITSHGLAAIRRQQEIIQSDVDRAIENARAVPIDQNLEILHTLPQEYVVDGQEGIKNPVGMHGVRLEVDVHIVAGTAGPLLNLRRCVQEAGLQVEGFVLHVLSSGLATLEASEQMQNTLVIDMGGGTTDVGLFKRGNLSYSASIPIGGDHVTADLAQILKIPLEEAENVKLRYGSALPEMADQNLTLEITSANGSVHVISAYELSRIIKPRVSEIYSLIRDEVDQALGPIELTAQSVILTGGAAHLRGAVPLARDRFRLPARLGKPRGISGLSDIVSGPSHACSVGMVLYGIAQDGKVPLSVFNDPHMIPADVTIRDRDDDDEVLPSGVLNTPPTPTPPAPPSPPMQHGGQSGIMGGGLLQGSGSGGAPSGTDGGIHTPPSIPTEAQGQPSQESGQGQQPHPQQPDPTQVTVAAGGVGGDYVPPMPAYGASGAISNIPAPSGTGTPHPAYPAQPATPLPQTQTGQTGYGYGPYDYDSMGGMSEGISGGHSQPHVQQGQGQPRQHSQHGQGQGHGFDQGQNPYDQNYPLSDPTYPNNNESDDWNQNQYGQSGQPYPPKEEGEKPTLLERMRTILKDWF